MPENWAEQVYEALVEVQKWGLSFDTLVLPWSWREQWSSAATELGFPRPIIHYRFAMIEKPIALIRD